MDVIECDDLRRDAWDEYVRRTPGASFYHLYDWRRINEGEFGHRSFYLAALSAYKYNKSCMALYERLVTKGKAKKLALIAVANKLIRQVFAVVKNNRGYDPDFSPQS